MPTRFRFRLPAPRTAPADGARGGLRGFARRRAGKVLIGSLVLCGLELAGVPLPEAISTLNWLILLVLGAWGLYRFGRYLVRSLLWRIRSKLLVSYLFIAVVPLFLLTAFFVLGGFLGLSLVASYTVSSEVERAAQDLLTVAKAALPGSRLDGTTAGRELEERLSEARGLYPRLRWALVREGKTVAASPGATLTVPSWLKGAAFAGLVRTVEPDEDESDKGDEGKKEGGRSTTTIRAVWTQDGASLLLDVPTDESLFAELKRRTGIAVIDTEGRVQEPKKGITIRIGDDEQEGRPPPRDRLDAEFRTSEGVLFFAVPEVTDWATGRREVKPIGIRYSPTALVRRLSPASLDVGGALVTAMAVVGASFLVVYCVALVLGLLLARSITRSIHGLSVGTRAAAPGGLLAPHPHPQPGPAGRAGRVLQRDGPRHTGPAAGAGGEGASGGGAPDRPADPDEPAAARDGGPARPAHRRALPARGRGGRRLLRPAAAVRHPAGGAGGRRLRQGHLRRALHGRAEGPGAVALADPRLAGPAAGGGQPDPGREHGPPLLHHHDLRGGGHGRAHAALRAGRPQPHDPPRGGHRPHARPGPAGDRAGHGPRATASRRSWRRPRSSSSRGTSSCSSPTASPRP